ncbi:MAG: EthD family reductase [Gemmatimonadota bacterium]
MIKVSVLYPNSPESTFDMIYYLDKHVPMVQGKVGSACKGFAVEAGIAGGAPHAPATYTAMGHLYFEFAEDFQSAFGPHAESILGDIPNFTSGTPVLQISEVKI